VKRAGWVDDVTQGDDGGKGDDAIELEGKGIKAAEMRAFAGRFVAHEHEVKFGLGHGLVAEVGDAEHEGGLAVERGANEVAAENDAGDRAGKANENEAGDNGHAEHADDDFDGGDDVAVKGIRIHVAIADGGDGLDTEEKSVRPRARGHTVDAAGAEDVAEGKEKVDGEIDGKNDGGKARPGEGEKPMVGVAEFPIPGV